MSAFASVKKGTGRKKSTVTTFITTLVGKQIAKAMVGSGNKGEEKKEGVMKKMTAREIVDLNRVDNILNASARQGVMSPTWAAIIKLN